MHIGAHQEIGRSISTRVFRLRRWSGVRGASATNVLHAASSAQRDIAIGKLLGSSIYNILLIVDVPALFPPTAFRSPRN